MKEFTAIVSFFFCWIAVAVIVGLAMAMIFPTPSGHAFVGIGSDLRNVPGTALGLLAGIQRAAP